MVIIVSMVSMVSIVHMETIVTALNSSKVVSVRGLHRDPLVNQGYQKCDFLCPSIYIRHADSEYAIRFLP